MKTVMDAVNELKGDLSNLDNYNSYQKGRLILIVKKIDAGGCIGSLWGGTDLFNNKYYEKLCSYEQFNTLVQECMTSFGSSVTYDEYLKELWANAPDDCVGAVTNRKNTYLYEYGIFVRKNKSSTSPYSYCGQTGVSPCMDYFTFTPKPQPKESNMKPVFTQEMLDAKELPPIGSEYLDEDGQVCKALLHYSSFVIGDMLEHLPIQQYPTFSTSRNDRIKPIDTRTDKEKTDDLFKLYLKGENVSTHKSFSQAVIDGDFGDNIAWHK